MKCYFTSTETVGLLGTGAQDVHLDFHTAWAKGKQAKLWLPKYTTQTVISTFRTQHGARGKQVFTDKYRTQSAHRAQVLRLQRSVHYF